MEKCRRCGTCCDRGGPTLHREDRELVASGVIRRVRLITMRKGETALDPSTGRLMPLPVEMIKIRGSKGWRCIFLQKSNLCAIYAARPLECRALKCWDTAAIEALFLKDLLARKDIVDNTDLLDIIEAYDQRLPAEAVHQILTSEDHAAVEELTARDLAFREAVMRNFGLKEEEMEALLGRSVHSLRRMLGLLPVQYDG